MQLGMLAPANWANAFQFVTGAKVGNRQYSWIIK
jgi:hypothetical protein